MTMPRRATGVKWALLACLAALSWPVPGAADDAMTALAFTPHQGALLPLDARFADATGQVRPLGNFLGGRPAIVSMGYYACPNMCELERTDLLHALARSGLKTPSDYTLVVVSIDPSETPAMARQAREDDLAHFPVTAAEQGWHFLTGDSASIQRLSRAVGFHARYDPGLRQYVHPMGLVFVTPAGMVSGYVLGIGYQPGDVRQAVAHAARGERVTASPILLLCFHYDETTGRYTLAVEKLLRIGAVLTVLMLGSVLAMAHGRGRR
ncbi:SCO family protein [Komagataeibacter sp. FNDCR2]|uniref:SCO family protein n=1 Tax=Komagataeibacter sp. FNDCR2 TaxID=2878682 RepID=UPI001E4C0A80|nr:SCO family protein [Komagataeibacter sp. FNDCR2]MCE2576579.1 SCO family protein [Komagataeibacter sp. FNDCR2]